MHRISGSLFGDIDYIFRGDRLLDVLLLPNLPLQPYILFAVLPAVIKQFVPPSELHHQSIL
jgi:hypothetical protein